MYNCLAVLHVWAKDWMVIPDPPWAIQHSLDEERGFVNEQFSRARYSIALWLYMRVLQVWSVANPGYLHHPHINSSELITSITHKSCKYKSHGYRIILLKEWVSFWAKKWCCMFIAGPFCFVLSLSIKGLIGVLRWQRRLGRYYKRVMRSHLLQIAFLPPCWG